MTVPLFIKVAANLAYRGMYKRGIEGAENILKISKDWYKNKIAWYHPRVNMKLSYKGELNQFFR